MAAVSMLTLLRALVSGCSSCAAKMRKILRGCRGHSLEVSQSLACRMRRFWRSDDWDLDEEPGLPGLAWLIGVSFGP